MSHGLNKNSHHTAIFLCTIGNKIMSFGDGAIKDSNIDSIKHNYTKITNITSKEFIVTAEANHSGQGLGDCNETA